MSRFSTTNKPQRRRMFTLLQLEPLKLIQQGASPSSLSQQPTATQLGSQLDPTAISGLPRRPMTRSGASAPVARSPNSLSQQPTTPYRRSQQDPTVISGLPSGSVTRSGASVPAARSPNSLSRQP